MYNIFATAMLIDERDHRKPDVVSTFSFASSRALHCFTHKFFTYNASDQPCSFPNPTTRTKGEATAPRKLMSS
jgi:hypothetical protein